MKSFHSIFFLKDGKRLQNVPTCKLASNWILTQNDLFLTKQNFDLTLNKAPCFRNHWDFQNCSIVTQNDANVEIFDKI